jgi:hypothetical protein
VEKNRLTENTMISQLSIRVYSRPFAVDLAAATCKQHDPLVLALHGFSGNYGTFMRPGCIEEAEKNGYILVGVMGYSPTAPFGNTNMFAKRPGTGPKANVVIRRVLSSIFVLTV